MTIWRTRRYSTSEAETLMIGESLGRAMSAGDLLALRGDLGAGKTTLARGVVAGFLGVGVDTPSPTFSLVQIYERGGARLWHFDLYRLETADDVWELGFEDAIEDCAMIEWPERAAVHLPARRLDIRLTPDAGGARVIDFEGPHEWAVAAP